jgi:hypothetical protein
MWKKLQDRWGVNSSWDVLVILIVFAFTGFSIMYIKRYLFAVTGLNDSEAWVQWTVNIIFILPLYQVVLLAWGWVFGKYEFFFQFVARMITQLGKLTGLKR